MTQPERILPVELLSEYELEVAICAEATKRAAIIKAAIEKKANRKGSLTSRFSKEAVTAAAAVVKSYAEGARIIGASSGSSFKKLCAAYKVEIVK